MRLAAPPRPWVKICGVTRPEDAAAAAALGAAVVGINFWPGSSRCVADLGAAREIAAAARERALVAGVFVDEDPERIEELAAECGLDLVQLHGDEPAAVVARFAPRAIRALRAQRATRDLPVRDQDQKRNQDKDERLSVEGKDGGPATARGEARALRSDRAPLHDPAESQQASAASPTLQWKPLSGEASGGRQPGFEQKVFCWLLEGPTGALYGGTGAAWDWAQARPVASAASSPVLVAGGIRPENVARALAASGAAGVDVASGVERAPGIKSRELMARLFEEVARVRE